MRFIVSVVDNATVKVAEQNYEAGIETWLLIYVGIGKEDEENYQERIDKFVDKISTLKCFHVDGKINSSIADVQWEILLISNFTLYGKSEKWQKLDFSQSADYATAEKIYNALFHTLAQKVSVKTWVFGGYMEVESLNVWPINLMLEF